MAVNEISNNDFINSINIRLLLAISRQTLRATRAPEAKIVIVK